MKNTRQKLLPAWGLCMALLLGLSLPALASKPGEAPPSPTPPPHNQSIQLVMQASLIFAHPLASAQAAIQNPAGSGQTLRYTLTIPAGEFERVTGHAAPLGQDLALFSSAPLLPGNQLNTVTLSPLLDGSLLPAGEYQAAMLVKPETAPGDMMEQIFSMQISVVVMADRRTATVAENGQIDLRYVNPTDQPLRLALLLSREELAKKSGLNLYEEGCGFSPKDSQMLLGLSEPIAPGTALPTPLSLRALPNGQALPAGEYSCHWVRVPVDTDAPYEGGGSVALTVLPQSAPSKNFSPLSQEEAFAYAQAAVNAEYLLTYTPPESLE